MDTDIQVMIVFSDMNSGIVHPMLYTPKVTKEEIAMLKCINMKSESECEGTDTEGMFECVCHFFGKSSLLYRPTNFQRMDELCPR